jgi:hypothetical protein
MMPSDPAVASLLIFLNVAPIGLYFVTLGLVNSHARPHRVSSRADFIALTCVLVPVLCWPIPALAGARLWWLLAAGMGLAAVLFLRLLPDRDAGWVIYNISEGRWRQALQNAARSVGLAGEWTGRCWQDRERGLRIEYGTIPLLRNVSVRVLTGTDAAGPGGLPRERLARLEQALDRHLGRFEQLPSASGALLLTLGVAVMILPLWVLGRHAPDVAAAVARLFN